MTQPKKSKTDKLVKRTYRIHESHDKKVKRLAKKPKSESQIVRDIIENHK